MPLEGLFPEQAAALAVQDPRKVLCERFGVLGNPWPSSSQTSGHPHMPIPADQQVDAAVREFYSTRKSAVIAVTASQGIGKTNLLNAYEVALRDKLAQRGFFVIRYLAD